MDTFLNGLDARLRVSGMVADSIMMGIVNSAMEDAYKKSCTKEGDLERLNEKSRFCELAIMQLEWCLKYLLEETTNNIFYETCDREGLLYDLLETRDRIRHRLEETELAIAEKDRELLELKEIAVDLRLALKLRNEDIFSLHAALGLEREKSGRAKKSFPCENKIVEKKGVNEIDDNELKDRVDQQIQKIRGNLVVGKLNLIEMIKGQHLDLLSLENLESRHDLDEKARSKQTKTNDAQVLRKTFDGTGTFYQELTDQLVIHSEEMVVRINMLKEKPDSSFIMMVNSMSSFKTVLNEQQWIWNFEKETVKLITRGFLKNMQNKFSNELGASTEDLIPFFFVFNLSTRSTLIDDLRKLHNVLDILFTRIQIQSKVELRAHHYLPSNLDDDGRGNLDSSTLRSESFIGKRSFSEVHGMDEDGCNIISVDGLCRIDGADALVEDDSFKLSAMPVKYYSKNESTRGKLSVDLISKIIRNKELIAQKENQDINWILIELAGGKRSIASIYYYSMQYGDETLPRVMIPMLEFLIKEYMKFSTVFDKHDSLYGKGQKLQVGVSEFHSYEGTRNNLCCQLTNSKGNERRKFEQEKLDLEINSMISNDIYMILLEGLIKRIHCESVECDIEAQISDEICKIILFEDWRNCNETCKMERLLSEEFYSIVFTGVIKDIILSLSCTSKKLPREVAFFDEKFFQSCQRGDMFNQIYKEARDSFVSLEFIGSERESAIKFSQHAQLLNGHVMFNLVNERLDKLTERISLSELKFGEFPSTLELICQNVASTCEQENILRRVGKCAQCSPQKFEDKHFCQLQFMLYSFAKVSQLLVEFEHAVYDKICLNVERLENLSCEIKRLVDRVKSVKENELLYQKAFMRRCYDLQTAEEEVDLLGDQVDVLLSLVKKIYSTLLHYSPILGNISKIMDILRSIEQELRGEPTSI